MYESGYYPPGAEHDPFAPYNRPSDTLHTCTLCNGTGHIYYAYDILLETEVECTEETYDLLPETEVQAQATDSMFIKGSCMTCQACDGNGEIEYEPDYDDYDD